MSLRIFAALAVFPLGLSAADIVKLHNGTILRADRADRDGDQIFLTQGANVSLLSASEVLSIEPEPDRNQPKPAAPLPAPPSTTKELIHAAARAHGLPPEIVESVAAIESALRTDAISHKGAIGVMQLMPGTARQLGVDPHDVEQNIEGGTRLLRELLLKYKNDPHQLAKALAAYNAGPGAVARYGGVPPYRETQNYIRRIFRRLDALEVSAKANSAAKANSPATAN